MSSYFSQLLSQQAYALRLPKSSFDMVERYVRTHQTSATIEAAPFRRQLDFWAFSAVTALAEGVEPLDGPSSKWGRKFVDTRAVQMSDRLCDVLAVVAFRHIVVRDGIESPDIGKPSQVIEIGNCFAGAGCPVVLEKLADPDLRLRALDKIIVFAESMYTDAVAGLS